MKTNYIVLILFLLGSSFFSCERPPEFPHEPKIAFTKVTFGEGGVNSQDSLSIAIFFEDGDGDLGLTTEEAKRPPFHENTYFSATPPYEPITNIDGVPRESLLQYGDLDTLPPYNCINYLIVDDNEGRDTLYLQPNPKGKNFLVRFFLKKDGGYEEFDFVKETCISANGTFTRLNKADHDRPLQGHLTYAYRAVGLRQFFGDYPIKLQIQIMDRAEHMSNVVESPDFTLDEVLLK